LPGLLPEGIGFFTVADAEVFAGAVALLNSLRLTGHWEPLVVLDAGLTGAQREILGRHCAVARWSAETPSHPALRKPFPRLLRTEGTLVFLDSDLIVTRSLRPIVVAAEAGNICAFPDPDSSRFFSEWRELFGLQNAPRRQTYVSSHFLAFSTDHWPDLLPRWWEACELIFDRAILASRNRGDPAYAGDQDALNALLMSEVPGDALKLLPARERATGPSQARSTSIIDRRSLACAIDGTPTTVIHIGGKPVPKPWQEAALRRIRWDAYVRLLRRLLHGDDVTLRYPETERLPVWLRKGALGALSFRGVAALNAVRAPDVRMATARRLAEPVYVWLRSAWRARRAN
jgi:hypothetical protein